MQKLNQIRAYLNYLSKAENAHGIHSPFVFDFYNNVIHQPTKKNLHPTIEKLRNELLSSQETLIHFDHGASGVSEKEKEKKIAAIAKRSLSTPKKAALINRIVMYVQPGFMLEMGTCLGISTAYLSNAAPHATLWTLEGCPNTLNVAKDLFEKLQLQNIKTVSGNFDETLESVLEEIPSLDLAFVDGNHRAKSTLNYFERLRSKAHQETVLIFDDIHWSVEMEQAWEQIKNDSTVSLTMDLYHLGIVFFRSGMTKQNFVLRF